MRSTDRCLPCFLVLFISLSACRPAISTRPLSNGIPSELISDGSGGFKSVDQQETNNSSLLFLKGINNNMDSPGDHDESCEQMYGFLPCSKSVPGHVFLILVYEYLLFHGESYVASGGEMIFKILGPGVFGACAFQIIGSLPEALILLAKSGLNKNFPNSKVRTQMFAMFLILGMVDGVVASGLLNSKEIAQECVLTGVGLLAGSSILLLSLVWGTSIIVATQNFQNYLHPGDNSCPSDSTKQNPLEKLFLSLWPGYGVVTDWWTGYTARIMLVSVIPFAIIQFPRLFHLSSFWERVFVVVALVVSLIFLLSYFFYQLFQPWIQRRQLLYLKHGHLVVDLLKHVQNNTMGSLFIDDGAPNLSVIRRLFNDIDHNKDNFVSRSELKDLLMDIKFGNIPQDRNAAASKIMEELDVNHDHLINEDEFVARLSKWLNTAYVNQTSSPEQKKDSGYQKNWEETDKLVEDKLIDKSLLAWIKAMSLVVLGIVMLGLLAEPLIHSVQNLSTAANIPSFFIAFIFVPFATNARIAISAISEARTKKLNINSLTFSEIYGTVLMNNLLGFSVLLSLIYIRGLSWNFSVEVLMVLIVTAVMGCLASFSNIFPVWTSLLAYLLYPLSLVLVNVLGDSNWLS